MTQREKFRNAQIFGQFTHAGAVVFLGCVVMVGVTSNIVWTLAGMIVLPLSLVVSHAYYIGGKAVINPIKMVIEVKEKQDALFKYLKLKATLVPRQWKITKQ